MLDLERLRAEYATSSGHKAADGLSLIVSVLVKALPHQIRQRIQIQMGESTNYEDLRRLVVGYESVTKRRGPNRTHEELGTVSRNGPAPTEVDLVTGKEGKKEGKGRANRSQKIAV